MSEDTSKQAWVEIRKKYNLNIFDKDIKNTYDLISSSIK